MKLKMFQHIRLKTGEEAVVIEIYDGGDYIVEIEMENGKYEQRDVTWEEVKSVFRSVEEPFVTA